MHTQCAHSYCAHSKINHGTLDIHRIRPLCCQSFEELKERSASSSMTGLLGNQPMHSAHEQKEVDMLSLMLLLSLESFGLGALATSYHAQGHLAMVCVSSSHDKDTHTLIERVHSRSYPFMLDLVA